MRISKTEEYGLRCILQLAREPLESTLSASEIAQREGISQQYASKLMHLFRKKGLVDSIRGLRGGFRLVRPAASVSVAEVLGALGGSTTEEDFCSHFSGDLETCVHTNDCSVRPVWFRLSQYFNLVTREIYLADLLNGEHEVQLTVSQLPSAQFPEKAPKVAQYKESRQ